MESSAVNLNLAISVDPGEVDEVSVVCFISKIVICFNWDVSILRDGKRGKG